MLHKVICKKGETYEMAEKPEFKPFSECVEGELIPLDQFPGYFIDYDGYGYYSTATEKSNWATWPSKFKKAKRHPKWATHIYWYNR